MTRNFGLAPSELPLLPPLRARGMAVLWSPSADVRDFLSVIEADPGLTATVLRAAKSAYSAPREPIHGAWEAIVRIGLDATRQVTSAAVMRAQFEQLDQSGLNVAAFWSRQLAVGLLTESFARHDHRPDEEVRSAFVTGLLHRVGRLPLAVRSPDRYRAVVELVRRGAGALEAEQQVFGIDAVILTKQVAARWTLPDVIADALSRQDELGAPGLPQLLRDAILITELLGFDEGFAEAAADVSALPVDHPQAAALDACGGADGLRARVERLTQALDGRQTPTLKVRAPKPKGQAPTLEVQAPTLDEAA